MNSQKLAAQFFLILLLVMFNNCEQPINDSSSKGAILETQKDLAGNKATEQGNGQIAKGAIYHIDSINPYGAFLANQVNPQENNSVPRQIHTISEQAEEKQMGVYDIENELLNPKYSFHKKVAPKWFLVEYQTFGNLKYNLINFDEEQTIYLSNLADIIGGKSKNNIVKYLDYLYFVNEKKELISYNIQSHQYKKISDQEFSNNKQVYIHKEKDSSRFYILAGNANNSYSALNDQGEILRASVLENIEEILSNPERNLYYFEFKQNVPGQTPPAFMPPYNQLLPAKPLSQFTRASIYRLRSTEDHQFSGELGNSWGHAFFEELELNKLPTRDNTDPFTLQRLYLYDKFAIVIFPKEAYSAYNFNNEVELRIHRMDVRQSILQEFPLFFNQVNPENSKPYVADRGVYFACDQGCEQPGKMRYIHWNWVVSAASTPSLTGSHVYNSFYRLDDFDISNQSTYYHVLKPDEPNRMIQFYPMDFNVPSYEAGISDYKVVRDLVFFEVPEIGTFKYQPPYNIYNSNPLLRVFGGFWQVSSSSLAVIPWQNL